MVEIERDENGRPLGDGYYILGLIHDPFNWKNRDEERYYRLDFRDYFYFRSDRGEFGAFIAHNRNGQVEYYPYHNIAYMELHKNSPEVAAAIVEWQDERQLVTHHEFGDDL